jgi:hypothetical protein
MDNEEGDGYYLKICDFLKDQNHFDFGNPLATAEYVT